MRARQSPAGWSNQELLALYKAFGFTIEHGAKHDKAIHPVYRLVGVVGRHAELSPAYVLQAVRLIEEALRLDEETEEVER